MNNHQTQARRHLIRVNRDLQADRRAAAEAFRSSMAGRPTLVVRLISSPGSGKTSLLESTARHLAGEASVGVLVGDVETDRDAQRLAHYAPSRQITTGGACHLELPLVERALAEWRPGRLDYLFLEDVGNLICPASHDLGEHLRVLLLSVTEGDDKPGKYPKAFRTSDAVVITKSDLLPYVPFAVDSAVADARRVRDDLTFFVVSAWKGEGLESWLNYLRGERVRLTEKVAASRV
jgi:hydrogenase nickel incorporation protein HypB